jgi:hypothetical protein
MMSNVLLLLLRLNTCPLLPRMLFSVENKWNLWFIRAQLTELNTITESGLLFIVHCLLLENY